MSTCEFCSSLSTETKEMWQQFSDGAKITSAVTGCLALWRKSQGVL